MAPPSSTVTCGPYRHHGRLAGLAVVACALLAAPDALPAQEVRVCTDLGAFTIELAPEAPAHTANFLRLVQSGFYNGTVFHRVLNGRIAQGGGFDRRFARRPAGDPVINESQNGLTNERGTVAAARLRDPDTATSQFYVNLTDNPDLDATSRRPGYTVFGRVTSGMEVLDAIGNLPTGSAGPLPREVPDPIVVIDAISLIGGVSAETAGAMPAAAGAETAVAVASDEPAATDAGTAAANGTQAPGTVLDRIDSQRANCEPVAAADLVDEAEAALAAGLTLRARFALDNYFVQIGPDDPDVTRAQGLFRQLPRNQQEGIAPLVAHCPSGAAPALPDGGSATLDEMQAAQAAIRQFITVSEAYIDCVSDVIDAGSLDDLQEVAAVSLHNETVTQMEQAAEAFNAELRKYRARD